MKSKKKNEMENAQNTIEATQELDMNALEDVAGGEVRKGRKLGGKQLYNVYDNETGELIAKDYDKYFVDHLDFNYHHTLKKNIHQ